MVDFTIQDSFFDKIAVADMERIHSAVLGWMLSDECSALTSAQKLHIINSLFGTNISLAHPRLNAINEYRHFDVYIELYDGNQPQVQHVFIIETKLKSSQHDDQLNKYEQEITDLTTQHLLFLTLINEPPLSNTWKSATFLDIVRLLKPNIDNNSTNKDSVILNEYFITLNNLCNAAKEFMKSPQLYPSVFLDGGLSKEDKAHTTPLGQRPDIMQYISKNNLETIFQKMYYQEVLNDCIKKIQGTNDTSIINHRISETRGNAEIGFVIQEVPCKDSCKQFCIDLAFQYGSFKFSIALDYFNTAEAPNNIKKLQPWEIIIKESCRPYGYTRNYKPRQRARTSANKKIDNWTSLTKSEFIEMIISELKTAKIIAEECRAKYLEVVDKE